MRFVAHITEMRFVASEGLYLAKQQSNTILGELPRQLRKSYIVKCSISASVLINYLIKKIISKSLYIVRIQKNT